MEGARSIPGQEQGPASKPAGDGRLRSALLKTFILGSDLCWALLNANARDYQPRAPKRTIAPQICIRTSVPMHPGKTWRAPARKGRARNGLQGPCLGCGAHRSLSGTSALLPCLPQAVSLPSSIWQSQQDPKRQMRARPCNHPLVRNTNGPGTHL